MKWTLRTLATVLVLAVTPVPSSADNIANVENARAMERAGAYLTRQDREQLRRYGATDDGWRYAERRYGYGYVDGYAYDGPVVYVTPRYEVGPYE